MHLDFGMWQSLTFQSIQPHDDTFHDLPLTKLANHTLPRHHHLQPSSLPSETLGSHGNHHYNADNTSFTTPGPSLTSKYSRRTWVRAWNSSACTYTHKLSSHLCQHHPCTLKMQAILRIPRTRSESDSSHHLRWSPQPCASIILDDAPGNANAFANNHLPTIANLCEPPSQTPKRPLIPPCDSSEEWKTSRLYQ